MKAHKPLYFSYLDGRHRGVPVAYATYHGREGFGFGESHMTWPAGAPAGLAEPAEVKAAPAFAAPAPIAPGEPGEPARSLALLLGRVE